MENLISKEQFDKIFPLAAKRGLTDKFFPYLNGELYKYSINTPLRIAAFLAQVAHESGELRFTREIWGPSDQQKKYDPPSKVADSLGNVKAGDGFLYRGRGLIQLTGRANYAEFSKNFNGDDATNFVLHPERLEETELAIEVAAWFWYKRGLNALADKGDFLGITKKINGGTTGYTDRRKYYDVALKVLGVA